MEGVSPGERLPPLVLILKSSFLGTPNNAPVFAPRLVGQPGRKPPLQSFDIGWRGGIVSSLVSPKNHL